MSGRAIEDRFEGTGLDSVNETEFVLGGCKVRLHFTEEPNKHVRMAVLTSLLYSAERKIREAADGEGVRTDAI